MTPLPSPLPNAGATASGAARLRTLALGAAWLLWLAPVAAQIATEPLLTRATAVRPNLLFVLDESGSMSDTDAYARHYYVATGTCGSSNRANLAPINNQLTYDPSKRYDPNYNDDGSLGSGASTSGFTDYTFYLPKAGQTITNLTTKEAICDTTRYDSYKVGTDKFYLNGTSKGTTNPISTKGVKRTDCAGTACTLSEEKKNIANFRAYHQTRLKAATAGIGKAFATQPDTFRLAWTTIHVTQTTPASDLLSGITNMKDYFLAKTAFYTWLNDLVPGSGTPLRKAVDMAGQYYSRADKNGPWAHSPWKTDSESELTSAHLSCRRSYTILVTDGEWNSDAASATIAGTDQDGVDGPEIVHNDGVTKYKYVPRGADGRNLGRADKSVSGTGYKNNLADVTHYYWARDLRGTGNVPLANDVTAGKTTDRPFWQNMITYTAGLGVQGTYSDAQYAQARAGTLNWPDPLTSTETHIDDLVHAAHNGGGEYLFVTDAEAFAAQIGRVVGSIAGEQFSQAGVAASAVTLTAGTKKFVPYYTANLWWGNLKMINLAENGDETSTAWQVVSTDILGKPTGVTTIPSATTRKVYTWTSASGGIEFKLTPLTSNGLRAASSAANTSTLLVDTMDADTIDFLRGERSKEGDTATFRKRESILGDIVNSTPVFIKNNSNFGYERLPDGTPGKSSYDAYMSDPVSGKAVRTEGVLFIGANDGMVHAFRESDGSETFAYVPQSVFGKLHQLGSKTYAHQFFVDGPMVETDAYINAPNKSTAGSSTRWANLVLGSTGAGARSVFALDTTWPTSMGTKSILWEINHTSTGMADLGYVMTEIQSGITASGDWVAIFGNGAYGTSGKAHLMVVNLATGALIKKIDTDTTTGNGLGGVRVVRNANGMIVGAYAGDLKGQVWRFDLSATSSTSWPSTGSKLFTATDSAGTAQPITAMPAVIARTDAPYEGYMVVVGTGKLYDTNDQSSTQGQAAYGLWDKVPFGGSATFSAIASDKSSLIAVTVSQETSNVTTATGLGTNPDGVTKYYKTAAARSVDWATDRGWYLNYGIVTGQRSIYAIEPIQELVRVDTIAPRLNAYSCAASTSSGNNYLVDPLTGTCKARTTLDTNGDGVIDSSDSVACIYSTEADGEDVVLDVLANGLSSGTVDIQDSRGHFKARVGEPAVCLNPTNSPCLCTTSPPACCGDPAGCTPPPVVPPGASTRDWRQLFMR